VVWCLGTAGPAQGAVHTSVALYAMRCADLKGEDAMVQGSEGYMRPEGSHSARGGAFEGGASISKKHPT